MELSVNFQNYKCSYKEVASWFNEFSNMLERHNEELGDKFDCIFDRGDLTLDKDNEFVFSPKSKTNNFKLYIFTYEGEYYIYEGTCHYCSIVGSYFYDVNVCYNGKYEHFKGETGINIDSDVIKKFDDYLSEISFDEDYGHYNCYNCN